MLILKANIDINFADKALLGGAMAANTVCKFTNINPYKFTSVNGKSLSNKVSPLHCEVLIECKVTVKNFFSTLKSSRSCKFEDLNIQVA